LPRTVDELNTAVLSDVMGTTVRSVRVLGSDAGTSSRARLVLTGKDVPDSVFVKLAAQTAATRLMGELGRLGHTEVRFYSQLAPELTGLPKAYGTAFDALVDPNIQAEFKTFRRALGSSGNRTAWESVALKLKKETQISDVTAGILMKIANEAYQYSWGCLLGNAKNPVRVQTRTPMFLTDLVRSEGELAEEMRGVAAFGLPEGLHQGSVEDLMDEGGFAGAADAGDADEEAEGNVDVDAAEVVDAGAGEFEVLAAGFAAVLGDGDGEAAGEVFAGDGVGVGGDFFDGSGGKEMAA